jgi:hypothetical protein
MENEHNAPDARDKAPDDGMNAQGVQHFAPSAEDKAPSTQHKA